MAKLAAFLALLMVVAYTVSVLLSGAPVLETELPGGLPAGNLLTAVSMCALGGMALILAPRGSYARVFAHAASLAAMAWLPVSVALAGTLELNFSGDRGETWRVFSLVVLSLLGAALLWAGGLQLLAALRREWAPALRPSPPG